MISIPFSAELLHTRMLHLYVINSGLPDDASCIAANTLNFNTKNDSWMHLRCSPEHSLETPPEQSIVPLFPDEDYTLSGEVQLTSGTALLSIIEYDTHKVLQTTSCTLTSGSFSLQFHTHDEHACYSVVCHLSGKGAFSMQKLHIHGPTAAATFPKLKWIIKNPAIYDDNLKLRGDYHFGASLTRHLEQLGQEVATEYYPHWETDNTADVILLLRGWYHYKPQGNAPFHMHWMISHPDAVTLKELGQYDALFVASASYARLLAKKMGRAVHVLHQCTDLEIFNDPLSSSASSERRDIIFVGGNYKRGRPCIPWAIDQKIPVKVWGKNWNGIVPEDLLQGPYIENHELPELYRRALATLNDHWPDMLRYGFLNNRTFDALACGLPVISDYHPDFESFFPGAMFYYKTITDLIQCVQEVNDNYAAIAASVKKAQVKIARSYSFARRAHQLVFAACTALQSGNRLSRSNGNE